MLTELQKKKCILVDPYKLIFFDELNCDGNSLVVHFHLLLDHQIYK